MQKRRCFFAASGGIWRFELFSRWLSERQIMNEHPCARAPPHRYTSYLPRAARVARSHDRHPPRIPPPMSTGGRLRMPPTQPGTSWDTSIVLVILVILDITRYAYPIESISHRFEKTRMPNPFRGFEKSGSNTSLPCILILFNVTS